MARKTRPIYDIFNGTLYDSVSSASKALGIDANNIRKVLNGKRPSAGGTIFIDAKTYTKRTLKNKAEKIYNSLTDTQMSKLAVQRGLNPQTALLQRQLQRLVKDANATLKELEKNRLTQFVPVANDIKIAYSQYLGLKTVTIVNERNEKVKMQLINQDLKNIQNLSEVTLNAMVQSLESKINSKSFNKVWASNEAERVAIFLGLNTAQIKHYRDIIPSLYEALQNTSYKTIDSDVIVATVQDMADNAKSPQYIIEYLEKENAYQSLRKDVLRIFHLSKEKFAELDSMPGLIDNLSKFLKIEQLHPDNNNLHNDNTQILKFINKRLNKNKLVQLNKVLEDRITLYSLVYGKELMNELNSMITYTDLLKFEEVINR